MVAAFKNIVPDPADQDRRVIETLLKSDAWEEQLRIARLKREKVLADRALAGAAAVTTTRSQDDDLAMPHGSGANDASKSAANEVFTSASVARNPSGPDVSHAPSPTARPRRAMQGVAIGLASGIALGLLAQPFASEVIDKLGLWDQRTAEVTAQVDIASPLPTSGQATSDAPRPIPSNTVSFGKSPSPALPSMNGQGKLSPNAVVPSRTIVPEVLAQAPRMSIEDVPVETSLAATAPLVADDSRSSIAATSPLLTSSGSHDDAVDKVLPPTPTKIVDLSYAPTSRMALADSPLEPSKLSSLFGTAGNAIPQPFLSSTPVLAPPMQADEIPEASVVRFLPAANSVRLTLHLSQADGASEVREKLAHLGVVDIAVSRSTIASARNMVVYYRPDDASMARILALLLDAPAMDMTGFSQVQDVGALDVYLTD